MTPQNDFFEKLNNNKLKGEKIDYKNLKKNLEKISENEGAVYNVPDQENAEGLGTGIKKMNSYLEVKIHYNPNLKEDNYQIGIFKKSR